MFLILRFIAVQMTDHAVYLAGRHVYQRCLLAMRWRGECKETRTKTVPNVIAIFIRFNAERFARVILCK